jgi:hypothetical protein
VNLDAVEAFERRADLQHRGVLCGLGDDVVPAVAVGQDGASDGEEVAYGAAPEVSRISSAVEPSSPAICTRARRGWRGLNHVFDPHQR